MKWIMKYYSILFIDCVYLPLDHIISSKKKVIQLFTRFKIEASNNEQQFCYDQVPLEKFVLSASGEGLHLLGVGDAGQETLPVTRVISYSDAESNGMLIPGYFVVFFEVVLWQGSWFLAEIYVEIHYCWAIADTLPVVIKSFHHLIEI